VWHLNGVRLLQSRQLTILSAAEAGLWFCADDVRPSIAVAFSSAGRPILPIRLITEPLAPQHGKFGKWFRNPPALHTSRPTSNKPGLPKPITTSMAMVVCAGDAILRDPPGRDLLRKPLARWGPKRTLLRGDELPRP